MEEPKPKQAILVRKDLRNKDGHKIRAGKVAAQVAHASMLWLRRVLFQNPEAEGGADAQRRVGGDFTDAQVEWFFGQDFSKIVLGVDSLEELDAIVKRAKELGVPAHVVLDQGRTEFDGPTVTCAALGPAYESRIDPITQHLKLY